MTLGDLEDWHALDPQEFLARWYETEYETTTYGGLAGSVQSWMHASLERGYTSKTHFGQVLELGANRGEHLAFLRHSYERYVSSDLSERCLAPEVVARYPAVETLRVDASQIPFDDATFDRLLHTCLLHHVVDPEKVLLEIRRVTKHGGQCDLFIPSDPGLAFRFARWIGPARSARRRGLGHIKKLVDARDHRNHAGSIHELVRAVFRGDQVHERTYPIPGLTWNTSLWSIFRVTKA